MELWIRWDTPTSTWVLFQRPRGSNADGKVLATLYEGGIISTETVDLDSRTAWKILANFEPQDRSTADDWV